MSWSNHADWWLEEIEHDPAYEELVLPLTRDLVMSSRPTVVLDVGCGEGRLGRALGCHVIGLDLNIELLRHTGPDSLVVRGSLPRLDCIRGSSFDAAVVSLVLEHIPDHTTLLRETARVVRPGGVLALVINHPVFTAPGSAPIYDTDGEMLWRPGEYFGNGYTDEPAGNSTVRFHHRSMADLLNAAAAAGWSLDHMVEIGVTDDQIRRNPELADQRHIPRLLGCRWINRSGEPPADPMKQG